MQAAVRRSFFRKCCTWPLSPPERRIPVFAHPPNLIGKSAQSAIAPKSVKPYPPKIIYYQQLPSADPFPSTLYNRKREEKARPKKPGFPFTSGLIRSPGPITFISKTLGLNPPGEYLLMHHRTNTQQSGRPIFGAVPFVSHLSRSGFE